MARWVQIRRYHVREGVLVERSVLESAGIPVMAPDLHFYALHPHLADSSRDGYCIFVLDDDVEDARAILGLRDDAQTSFPCPTCGGKTRRLKNLWAMAVVIPFLWFVGGPMVWPVRRRKRICNADQTRFMPEPTAPFTSDETRYLMEPPEGLPLKERFRRFLAWTRSIGYDKRADLYDSDTENRDP